jgi:signal transduction histidine kinase
VARSRHVVVQTALENDVVGVVDPAALRQILLNLLDNAVKYGPLGQTVTITLERANDRARITVDDEGPGIPPEQRGRVWEPYQRLESAVTAAVAGSGIGLSVVAQLVSLHGGRAWVEGAPGRGARFIVELPLTARREPGTGNRERNGEDGAGVGTADQNAHGASVPGSQFPAPSSSRR